MAIIIPKKPKEKKPFKSMKEALLTSKNYYGVKSVDDLVVKHVIGDFYKIVTKPNVASLLIAEMGPVRILTNSKKQE